MEIGVEWRLRWGWRMFSFWKVESNWINLLQRGTWIAEGDVLPEPVSLHGSATAFHLGCPKSAVEGHIISLVYDASLVIFCELLSIFFRSSVAMDLRSFCWCRISCFNMFEPPFFETKNISKPIRRGSKVQWESHHHSLGGSKVPRSFGPKNWVYQAWANRRLINVCFFLYLFDSFCSFELIFLWFTWWNILFHPQKSQWFLHDFHRNKRCFTMSRPRKFLEEEGLLKRVFTQNIDGLDYQTGGKWLIGH